MHYHLNKEMPREELPIDNLMRELLVLLDPHVNVRPPMKIIS